LDNPGIAAGGVPVRPLNFLHLTTFYPPYSFGGDAMYVYRLSHALGDAGHYVDVVHCTDAYHLLHPDPPPQAFAEHPRVHRHALKSRWGRLSPIATHQTGRPWFKRRRIRELLASRPYDVVQFHNTSLIGPHAMSLESPHARTVKLYMTHEHWLVCPMHVLWKFNERPCDSPQCLRCTLQSGRPPQMWRYTGTLRRMGRHIDRYVSPSRFTAAMHAERGFPYPVHHLPYFIDRVDRDWQQPGSRPQERPYCVFVGRLEVIKGVQDLIALWDDVPECDLLIAGTGTHEAELRRMAAGNPRIRFLGGQSQAALGALYFHAAACLVPSLTYETFGIIVVEAFARKTPVVVRDLGALPEIVQESGGGFIFRDRAQLLEAIRRLTSEPALRTRLGELGYQTFLRLWTREAHLEQYFAVLRDVAWTKFGCAPWEAAMPAPVQG
jgi:glycosyltransferase involved in cell wall biosynthesis